MNSVRYALDEDIDDCSVFRNINNSLSCEEEVLQPYSYSIIIMRQTVFNHDIN